jgi:hypothetical protein
MASAITRALATAVNELAAQLASERIRHHIELKEVQQRAMDATDGERNAESALESLCGVIDKLAEKHGIESRTKSALALLVELDAMFDGKAAPVGPTEQG